MILAGINAKYMPLKLNPQDDDPIAAADHETRERSLLFVCGDPCERPARRYELGNSEPIPASKVTETKGWRDTT